MMSCCYSYRLAPEAVFPDQYHDALAASRAFLSPEVLQRYSIDPERTCVSGDSAGGNLAAAVAQEVNKTNTPLTTSYVWYQWDLQGLCIFAHFTFKYIFHQLCAVSPPWW